MPKVPLENLQPKSLEPLIENQEMSRPETEKVLEVNLGPFGGLDSKKLAELYQKALDKFLAHLKVTNPLKYKSVKKFWDNLKKGEVPETGSLFENSLGNWTKVFLENMRSAKPPKPIFLLLSIGEEFNKLGEENFFIFEEMQTHLGGNARAQTVFDFLTVLKDNETSGVGNNFLEEYFLFDDFTDEELEAEINKSNNTLKYKEKEITVPWAKNILRKIASLYPKELEKKAGRDFPKHLQQPTNNSRLLKSPIYGDRLSTHRLLTLTESGETKSETVEVKYGGNKEPVSLANKVLKVDPSNSGDGVYFYHPDANKMKPGESKIQYFNELTIRDITKGKQFTLEDYVEGPKILIPYNLDSQSYGELTQYTVDVRFGYYFDPKSPNEIRVISSYGRFNYPGRPSNIAKGGGVVDIKVVKDEDYVKTKTEMHQILFSLSAEDGKQFQTELNQQLQENNITYKDKPLGMSSLPFIISESAYEKMKAAALQVAKNLNSDQPFIFALDAFLNPSGN